MLSDVKEQKSNRKSSLLPFFPGQSSPSFSYISLMSTNHFPLNWRTVTCFLPPISQISSPLAFLDFDESFDESFFTFLFDPLSSLEFFVRFLDFESDSDCNTFRIKSLQVHLYIIFLMFQSILVMNKQLNKSLSIYLVSVTGENFQRNI